MCGIAGLFAHAGAAPPVDGGELARMAERMRARGPDGEGHWLCETGRIGLAHRRLAIIDLSPAGAQPMWSDDRRHVVTFNGEIYNYKALRAELAAQGCVFRSTSDTEVLLHAWRQMGPAMVGRLRGMFAFALWDVEERTLFLARDPLGIKPLYYADDGRTLRFASQVKALLAGGAIDGAPDPAGWAGFYLLGSVPEPFTTHRAIRALPAGSTMLVKAGEGAGPVTRYSAVGSIYRDGVGLPPTGRLDDGALHDAIRQSVAAHLVADVKVGCFLSGGVDSGALLGLMSERGGEPVTAVTLAFGEFAGTINDEVPLARAVGQAAGADHHVRVVDGAEFAADLPAIMAAMDQPTIDAVNSWFVSKAAAELGLKVALSGLGGDELFGGYSTFREVPRWARWLGPLAHRPKLRSLVQAGVDLARLLPPLRTPKLGSFAALGGTFPGAYLLRRGLFMPDELAGLMGVDQARSGLEALRPLDLVDAALDPDPATDFARVATLETSLYMRNQLLRDMDWASMAHSLEVRVPLVDATLLAAFARAARRPTKTLLAQAPARPLPDAVTHRRKTGFSTPVALWRQQAGASHGRQAATARRPLSGLTSRDWAVEVARMWPETL